LGLRLHGHYRENLMRKPANIFILHPSAFILLERRRAAALQGVRYQIYYSMWSPYHSKP
jgi:hypothetical protein